MKPAWTVIVKILLRTVMRFNPLCQPVVPALVTMNLLAVVFTILYIRDKILCTFIIEYKEIMLSAWGFVLLMNFLEELMDAIYEHDNGDRNE